MKTKFEKEVNKIMKRGIKELKKTGSIEMKAFIFGNNSEVYKSPMFWYDHPAVKQLEISRVRNLAKFHNAKCVVLLADTFVGKTDGIRPSLDPERDEAIILVGEDEKGKFQAIRKYVRRKNNKIKLGKTEAGRPDELKGLLIEEPFGVCS